MPPTVRSDSSDLSGNMAKLTRKKKVPETVGEKRKRLMDLEVRRLKAKRAAEEIEQLGRPRKPSSSEPKIVQILLAPEDPKWQGALIGLGSNGVTYICTSEDREWEPIIEAIK